MLLVAMSTRDADCVVAQYYRTAVSRGNNHDTMLLLSSSRLLHSQHHKKTFIGATSQ